MCDDTVGTAPREQGRAELSSTVSCSPLMAVPRARSSVDGVGQEVCLVGLTALPSYATRVGRFLSVGSLCTRWPTPTGRWCAIARDG
jgi:hypothetical protein